MATPLPVANNADVRYLGTLLGEVIRAHGGEALFAQVEAIRTASVERHRSAADTQSPDGDHAADLLGLETLGLDDTIAFTRGYMLFSMLANLAEDRQNVAAELGATLAAVVVRLAAEGVDSAAMRDLLSRALVAPVLTAHPTKVRRKSMIDHRNRIAELMALRDRVRRRARTAIR